ncbi:MAG: molybdenum cofactor biosynthesis protein MoaB [Xanthobacteraceae bacterium]|nr:molybdenum cofactor biosynthesis protein MoaB [Xanthobacteraceae bacterium]
MLNKIRAWRWNEAGKAEYAAGRPHDAKLSFQKAADLGAASGWYNLGLLHAYFQQEELGTEYYRKGFEINPDYKRHADLRLMPNDVQIETVRACNAACVMCPIATSPTPARNMDDALFESLAGQLVAMPTSPRVSVYGLGEPLMDKKIARRVRHLKQVGVKHVSLVSNATLMDSKTANDLIDAGLDSICFSIDSVVKETYEAIRLKLKLDEAIDGVMSFVTTRNARAPNISVTMIYPYSEQNRDEMAGYRAYWAERLTPKLDVIAILPVHSFGQFKVYATDLSAACGQIFFSMHLRADGRASMCCIDVESEYKIGDATKMSLADVFNDDQIRSDRHRHLTGRRHEIDICGRCDQPECGKVGFGYNFAGPVPELQGRLFYPGTAA